MTIREGDDLRLVAAAIGRVEAGEPVDLPYLRARLTATVDQLEGGMVDERMGAEGRCAAAHLAIVGTALHAVLDRLQEGDTDGARKAFRDALWAPSGQLAPEAPPPRYGRS